MPKENRIQIWSSGGGVQSTAIAVLIAQGKLPKPDIAVIADTGREASSTWRYLNDHVQPLLDQVGVTVHRIHKRRYCKVDLYSNDHLLIPAFTDINGKGKFPGWCSGKWKQDVIRRFCRKQFGEKTKFTTWLGFSTDELRRVKATLGKWQNTYPLIDLRLSRSECIALVESTGLPTPPRSSCWMCPNRSDAEWIELKQHAPLDFLSAVVLERQIQDQDPNVWLHPSCQPLSEVSFGNNTVDAFQNFCDSGMCFV